MKFYLLAAITAGLQLGVPNLEATDVDLVQNHLHAKQRTHCSSTSVDDCREVVRGPRGPRGCKGPRGHRGQRGRTGPNGSNGLNGLTGAQGATGATGPAFEINDFLEATNSTTFTLTDLVTYVPFTSPIVYPVNGIVGPGLTLVESVPLSGNFDTVTLPAESTDTLYLVTFGVSLAVESFGVFELELNGAPLPYTNIGVQSSNQMMSQTNIIRNPANTIGTLRVLAIAEFDVVFTPPLEGSSSAYITVLKLNNNGP